MEFAGNKTEMEYKLSAAYRPMPDKLTLGADWNWAESQAVDEGFFKFYAAFRIREGMGVLGSIDEDGNFGFGINLSFGSNQIGTYHNFSDDADYRSGLIYSGYTYRPQGWILPVKKKILKLDLTGSYPETEQKYYFWQQKQDNFLKPVSYTHLTLPTN